MGKTKGFLYAIQHREVLMTDLGLYGGAVEQGGNLQLLDGIFFQQQYVFIQIQRHQAAN